MKQRVDRNHRHSAQENNLIVKIAGQLDATPPETLDRGKLPFPSV